MATAVRVLQHGQDRRAEDRFYLTIAALAIATAITGFAPSLVHTTGRRAPVSTLGIVHGILCMGWLVLFQAQIWLAASRRVSIHKRLGVAAGVLASALVATGYATVVALLRRGFDLSGDLHVPPTDAVFQVVFPLGDLLTFAVLVTAGYLFRRRTEIHRRLMLFATLGGLMPAALAHLIGHYPALSHIGAPMILIAIATFFFARALFEWLWHRRVHPVSLWTPIVLMLWGNLRATLIGPSAAWHHFVAWLAR